MSHALFPRNAAAVAVIAAMLMGGCDVASDRSTDMPAAAPPPSAGQDASPAPSARFPRPIPSGVMDPAVVPPSPASDCDPRRSYRPVAPEPEPASKTLTGIRERRELRIGTSQVAYLMSFQDGLSGDMSGFEVDIAREIARELGQGIRITFIEVNAADREQAINSGRIDMMLRGVSMTCARWTETAFSAEYLASGQRVLVHKKSSFTDIESLGGRKVCASQGSTSLLAIDAVKTDPKPVSARNVADCMLLLQQGYVDAISTGGVLLAGLAQQDATTHVVGPPFTDEPLGIAMSLDAIDLVRIVNRVLERIRTDGSWDRFYAKWLRPIVGEASAPVPRYRD